MKSFGRFSLMALALSFGFTVPTYAQTTQRGVDEKAKKEEEEREKERLKKEAESKALRAKVAQQLKFEVELPEEAVPWKRMNSTRFNFQIKVTNPSEYPAVIAPFFTLKVVDGDGDELKPRDRAERYYRLTAKEKKNKTCRLDAIAFFTIPAGKTRLIPVNLANYDYDPRFKIGYKFVGAGSYRLLFTYEFSREKFLKTCVLEECENHDGDKKPWNRASDLKRAFEGKLKVSEN